MKRFLLCLTLAVLGLGVYQLAAQVGAKRSGIESRLAQALKLFPAADTNKNGMLSIDEALAYAAAHPELKEQFLAKSASGKGSGKPASFAPGAVGTKVFVCAHSFMIFTADWLPQLATAAGVPHLRAGQQMIGGSRVSQHWALPDERNFAKQALKEGQVDVLTLSPHVLLPDEGIDEYTKLGLKHQPALRVLVQVSWAPQDGHLTGDFSNTQRDAVTVAEVRAMRELHHTGWLKALEAQVNALNASVGQQAVFILPVSDAVYALRERVAEGQAPGLRKQSEMFRDNLGHPTAVTELLISYCHFAAIYKRTPIGLPVPPQLKNRPQAAALNTLLQELAWAAVTSHPLSGVKADLATTTSGAKP